MYSVHTCRHYDAIAAERGNRCGIFIRLKPIVFFHGKAQLVPS